jgi:hypothetical protein
VLDISGDGWIAGFLYVPDGIDLISTHPDELAATIQPDDLVLDAVPVQSGEDGLLAHVRTVVSHLVPGASAVLLTRDSAADLPLDRIERVTTSVGCKLLEVAELAYPAWPAAVVVGCGVEPRLGESTMFGPSAVFVRGSLGRASVAARGAVDGPAEDGTAPLRAQLLERDQTIRRLEREMRALRSSAGLQLGAALIEAVKRPSAAPRLPGRLVEIARRRNRGGANPAVPRPQDAQAVPATDVVVVIEDSRLLAWSSEPADRTVLPEICGIVTDTAAEMLSHHSALRRPVPHEARLALERALPDVVLIQASALLAPSAWGHAGTPGGAVSHARSLFDMVVLAGVLGVPVVVWQDIRPSMTPALGPLVRRADLVIGGGDSSGTEPSWSPGVSLAAFHPTAKTSTDKVLVVPERRTVAASAEARFRRELDRTELAAVRPLWSPELGDAIRTHAVALASPLGGGRTAAVSDLTLASIASGARVLSGPNDTLLGAFPSAVMPVSDPAAVVGAAEALLAMPELSPVERRLNLRRIFDFESTPIRLGQLAASLGLRPDPMASRRVTVVVEGVYGRDTAVAIDNLLDQTSPPARILVAADEVPDRALDEVRALGIDVAVVRPGRSWSALAGATDSAWVMVWPNGAADAPRGLLHDLLAAAESVQADAIGALATSPVDLGYGRFVDTLPIEGSLIRRAHLSQLDSGTDLGVLAERGLRLFAVHDAGSDR